MERVPETKASELDKIQKELLDEVNKWNRLGMDLEGIATSRAGQFFEKMQVQALINLGLERGLFTNEEFNIEFKKLVRDEMIRMREAQGPKEGKIAVPEVKIFDQFGRDMSRKL